MSQSGSIPSNGRRQCGTRNATVVSVSPELRRQVALLCRRGPSRYVARNLPCDWHPTSVLNAATGLPYTDAEAFGAIAAAFEDVGVEVRAVTLRVPPGKTALEVLIPQPGRAPIYAKVQLGAGVVLARSFHYSDYAEKVV